MSDLTDNPKVFQDLTPDRGIGLFARKRIYEGERIASFDGRVFQWTDIDKGLPNEPPDHVRDHAIQFEEFRARDSNGFARYANHSCQPNCGVQNLFDLIAMSDIPAGREITWDYDMAHDNANHFQCKCGSPDCRKFIAGYRFLPPQIRRAYEGYLAEWLLTPPRRFVGYVAQAYGAHRVPTLPKAGEPFAIELSVETETITSHGDGKKNGRGGAGMALHLR